MSELMKIPSGTVPSSETAKPLAGKPREKLSPTAKHRENELPIAVIESVSHGSVLGDLYEIGLRARLSKSRG